MTQEEIIERFVCSPCRVAIVGASFKEERPVFHVANYLKEHDFDIAPVNPVYAGTEMFGALCAASIEELMPPPDVVAIFLAPERQRDVFSVLHHSACRPVVWFQPGSENPQGEQELREEGFEIVSNACMMMVHEVYCANVGG